MLLSDEKIQEIFNSVVDNLNIYRKIPIATYRLQFNHQFKFSDATMILPYLHELGISDVYTSPYFKAKKGSLHGYDILSHHQLNPEIGTDEEYETFTKELARYGMGQVLDIVPNHMCIADDENVWWMDVLENGPSSIYADFFDIVWKPVKNELENKVLLPVLGDQYGRVLENQELRLIFEEGAFFVRYYGRKFPVAPISSRKILEYRLDAFREKMGSDHVHLQELLSIITGLIHLPPRTEKDPEKIMERRREKEIIKKRLRDLYHESEEVRSFIEENVNLFNGDPENPRSFDLLDDLLNDQAYRLSHWQVATEEINYRRFFDINELGSIRMEDPRVFEETHRLIFRLIREKKVTGLRVDHPDGLYNPSEYFYRLQRGCFIQFCLRQMEREEDPLVMEEIGRLYDEAISQNPASPLQMPLYVVGEKILTKSERMPEGWPIFSTTGYVFLNAVNGIFIDMAKDIAFNEIYRRFLRFKVDYPELVYEKKRLIMQTSMPSEINMLGHYLNRISEKDRHTRDFTLNNLTTAIIEVIANFPVYRTYVTSSGVNERDRRYIDHAVSRAKKRNPALSATVFDFLRQVLLIEYPERFGEADRMEWLDFVMRFQQITGPVMAKGVEDTVFYVYNRFVSLNEVGGNPERFGTSLETFHGMNIEREKYWPDAMITTSTHDTKRGEDVRARLNVLSEMADEWRESIGRWSRMNKRMKSVMEGQWVPDRNEEYLLYQTLIGAWPLHPMDEAGYKHFKKRISDYMLKAIREAKVNTGWISPNLPYEENLLKFIEAILSPAQNPLFLRDIEALRERVSYLGMFNSLSQTLLKITCPGIPDFYQGTEIWDFSLVDPDNRRPVDYSFRRKMLGSLKERIERTTVDLRDIAKELLQEWRDGSIKLYIMYRSLNYRKANRQVFMEGTYIPLMSGGDLRDHVCAFARRRGEKVVLVVVPRFLTGLMKSFDEVPLGKQVWGNSRIVIPDEISGDQFRNIFTNEMIEAEIEEGEKVLTLSKVFANFPVAMLEKI
ncbi:MAG: malto-oligosyltrehalose synthase [Deltaproteobacteria bacterium]|nr:malto-oligosyltrehalose synthase [Deltaproteobacteria bacterium]